MDICTNLGSMNFQTDSPSLDSIRSRQIVAIRTIINLNQPVGNSMVNEPIWKVLVMDKFVQDVVSPLLPLKQLRDLGVTLHPLLTSHREPLVDAPAVYLISPTDENVAIIAEDLKKSLYESFYLNFISPLSRPRLECLASAAVQGGVVQQVSKVVDQYLNFISLEDDLFVLRRYNESNGLSYHMLNDPSTSDATMNAMIESIADALFAVCATMGVVPIIRCPKDNASEHVAKKLEQKLRDNLRDARNNLFAVESVRAGQLHATRPLLLIADRSADLATMLHHTWTYQALIHDVMDFEQNMVKMTDSSGKRKEYDMNSSGSDNLWFKHKGSAFPLVAESIQEDLESYRSSEDEIRRLKHAMGVEGDIADDALAGLAGDATDRLNSTVQSLPQLLEKKKLIDQHTNIATHLLDVIKQRKLDVLFELEQKLLQRSPLDRPLLEILSSLTDPEDMLRVVLINFLCADNISKNDLNEQINFLKEKGIDESALLFVQKMRSFTQMGRSLAPEEHQGAGTKTISMFNKLLSNGSRFVMEGVKNLVPKKHNLPLTRMVDTLVSAPSSSSVGINQMMGATQSSPADELCYFDPKLMQAVPKDIASLRSRQPAAQDVILFVIGGGNYVEYQNLIDYGKFKNLQRVTYGCTELVNPTQFVDQLTRLGRCVR